MENKRICECPYYKSCHRIRQKSQVEYREKTKRGLNSCPFFPYLKEMYDKLNELESR